MTANSQSPKRTNRLQGGGGCRKGRIPSGDPGDEKFYWRPPASTLPPADRRRRTASKPLASQGFWRFAAGLLLPLEDSRSFDYVVFATRSGCTQAGMVVGAKLTNCASKLLAISIDQVPAGQSSFDYKSFVLSIAQGVNTELQLGLSLSPDDFPIITIISVKDMALWEILSARQSSSSPKLRESWSIQFILVAP